MVIRASNDVIKVKVTLYTHRKNKQKRKKAKKETNTKRCVIWVIADLLSSLLHKKCFLLHSRLRQYKEKTMEYAWSISERVCCECEQVFNTEKKMLVIHLIPFNDKKKKREKTQKCVSGSKQCFAFYLYSLCIFAGIRIEYVKIVYQSTESKLFSFFVVFSPIRYFLVRAWIWAHDELNETARNIHNWCDSTRRYKWTANCSPKIRWALARNPNTP